LQAAATRHVPSLSGGASARCDEAGEWRHGEGRGAAGVSAKKRRKGLDGVMVSISPMRQSDHRARAGAFTECRADGICQRTPDSDL
jgi:hypothetical protein